MTGYVKIELTGAVLKELKNSLPHFRFMAQKAYKVRVECKKCWVVDDLKLPDLIKRRESIGFQELRDLHRSNKELEKAYSDIRKRVFQMSPNDQRELLRRARVPYEAVQKKIRLLEQRIDFSEYVTPAYFRHYLLEVVDWAMSHKCSEHAARNNAIAMAESLFELGISPRDELSGASKSKRSSQLSELDQDDLLDLIPE